MMLEHLILIFLIKIFALFSGFRIVKNYFSEGVFNKTTLTKIGSIYVVFMTMTTLFVQSMWLQLLFAFLPISVVVVCVHFIYINSEKQFQKEFPEYLASVILFMKVGRSFRSSCQHSLSHLSCLSAQRMSLVMDHVTFSQQSCDKSMTPLPPYFAEIVESFVIIDQSESGALQRLEQLRKKLHMQARFRRRSGQIRGQILIQAYLMTFIYVGCLAFVSFRLQTSAYAIVTVSAVLFIAGLIGVLMIGRRIEWDL